jgi:iron complex outermembrane receptor protein
MIKTQFFCFLLATFTIVKAQNSIGGKISDKSDLPLTGATIYFPELNKGTISDGYGNYELRDLPSGRHKIQFSFIGYKTIIQELELPDTILRRNVVLDLSAVEGQEIVVSGGYNSSQHENAVKIDILKLNNPGLITSSNFTQSLQKIPGIDMISKGSGVSKPVIRGLSMNDILVLNNGVRFENYQYSSHHPLGIDEFGIDEVEVIKGPASLLYGSDAIGGVLNFIREKPAPVGTTRGDYTMQLFSNTLGLSNNLGIKGSSKRFFGGIRTGQKTNADFLQGGGSFAHNSRFNEYSINSFGGLAGKSGTYKINYDYSDQKLGLTEPESIVETPGRGRNNKVYYQQFNTHLISSQNKLYFGKMKFDINSSFQNTELSHFGIKGLSELQMKLSTVIYEAKLYLPSNNRSEYILGIQGVNQANTNINNRETILLPNAVKNNYSVFGLIQRSFFSRLKIQLGTRYDYSALNTLSVGTEGMEGYRMPLEKKYGSFSGSIGIIYNFSREAILRSNLATGYRTPNLAELTSNGQHESRFESGNQDLVPENSLEWDLSLHVHKDNITFDIACFYNQIHNYIFINPTGDTTSSGIYIYHYNQNNSFLYGGEAGLHIHPMLVKWIHIEAGFSTVKGFQQDNTNLPFIPAKKLNTEIRGETNKVPFIKNGYIGVGINKAFDQKQTAPDETKTSGYTLFNTNIGGNIYSGKQVFQISIGCDNIFDKKYTDHLSTLKEVKLFNPGRNISLSVKIPFGN